MLEQAAFAVDSMSWQKQLITPAAMGKGGKWCIRSPSAGSFSKQACPCVVNQQQTSTFPAS